MAIASSATSIGAACGAKHEGSGGSSKASGNGGKGTGHLGEGGGGCALGVARGAPEAAAALSLAAPWRGARAVREAKDLEEEDAPEVGTLEALAAPEAAWAFVSKDTFPAHFIFLNY